MQAIPSAQEYFMSPGAYAPFDIMEDGRRMGGCIDPRADDAPVQLAKLQGPGGEVGERADHSQALTAVSNRLVTLEEAVLDEGGRLPDVISGAHRSTCAYAVSYPVVMGEAARPSRSTVEAVSGWVRQHRLGNVVTDEVLERVQSAAAQQVEHMGRTSRSGAQRVIEAVDAAHPAHTNVPNMRDGGAPGFYVVNHHPALTLDRARTHGLGVQPQAYHDSLGARLDAVRTMELPPLVRAARLGAALLRSAATRTVITTAKEEAGQPLRTIEVGVGNNGEPVFREVSLG